MVVNLSNKTGYQFVKNWSGQVNLWVINLHSWAQRKLSPLSPLSPSNILLSINGPLLSLGLYGFND